MAVLIEAVSVIIRVDVLLKKFPGGWDAFQHFIPNKTLCADTEIARVGFMSPQDVESFIKNLQNIGLEFLRSGEAIEIAVADQILGLTSKCSWLELYYGTLYDNGPLVTACSLVGSRIMGLVTPSGWEFEDSLSSSFGCVPIEHEEKVMKYLRHENGYDIYLNPTTGKEMYAARTGEYA